MKFDNVRREDVRSEKQRRVDVKLDEKKPVKTKNTWFDKLVLLALFLGIAGLVSTEIEPAKQLLSSSNEPATSQTSVKMKDTGLLLSYKKPKHAWVFKDGALLHLDPTVVYLDDAGAKQKVTGPVEFDGVKRLSGATKVTVETVNGESHIRFSEN